MITLGRTEKQEGEQEKPGSTLENNYPRGAAPKEQDPAHKGAGGPKSLNIQF